MRWWLFEKVLACVPGQYAVGQKNFSGNEEFFLDHFPDNPIVPGVLQLEMMGGVASVPIRLGALNPDQSCVILAKIKSAKFYRAIRPKEKCIIFAKIVNLDKEYAVCEGWIEVNQERVSESTFMYVLSGSRGAHENRLESLIAEWKANGAPEVFTND